MLERDFHFNLTLFQSGTIRDLFSQRRVGGSAPRVEPSSPLALPGDPLQCVHVEALYLEVDGKSVSSYPRCVSSAVGGWLCATHAAERIKPIRYSKPKGDPDVEVVESILATEARAIAASRVRGKYVRIVEG